MTEKILTLFLMYQYFMNMFVYYNTLFFPTLKVRKRYFRSPKKKMLHSLLLFSYKYSYINVY